MKKNWNKKEKIEVVLVVVAMVAWALRKLKLLYIPALTSFSLGISMGLLGLSYVQDKIKSHKAAGVLLLAFGLLNIVVGIMEIYSAVNGL